jgi:transposase
VASAWGTATGVTVRLRGKDKAEIIELCQRADGPAGQLANERDPTATAVRAWLDLPGRDAGTCEHGWLTSADRRELADLRRENRRLREDVEILKRAAAMRFWLFRCGSVVVG